VRAACLRLVGASALAALILAGCGDDQASEATDLFDAEVAFEDVGAQVEIGPRPSGSRGSRQEVRYIERELRRAGVEDVEVQHPYANVVGTIPGEEPGAIVVGAHHDTKNGIPGFVGANDGASGVAVVLGLARALEAPVDGPSIHLAFFDAEEARGDRPFADDGTRGSRQYVDYARDGGRQGSPSLGEIEAMVLFDLIGDCDLQIPREAGSDAGLFALFAEDSKEASGEAAPFAGTTTEILDDHVPFLEAGVPAVDLIDFRFGPGPEPGSYWHTPQDTLDKVCEASLDAVGEAAVRAIPRIGAEPGGED
jgi:glutaminyl-peptide cyclotransferase